MVIASDEQRRTDAPSQATRPRKIQTPKRVKTHRAPRMKPARVSVLQQTLDEVRDKIQKLLAHADRSIAESEAALKHDQAMVDESRFMIVLAEKEGIQVDRCSLIAMEQSCAKYATMVSELTATKKEVLRVQKVFKTIEGEVTMLEANKEAEECDRKHIQDSVTQLHDLLGKLAL